jgi:hypothetical protein
VPSNYFIQCSWGLPYLNKCPPGTDLWSQDLLSCVVSTSLASSAYPKSSYGQSSYANVQ